MRTKEEGVVLSGVVLQVGHNYDSYNNGVSWKWRCGEWDGEEEVGREEGMFSKGWWLGMDQADSRYQGRLVVAVFRVMIKKEPGVCAPEKLKSVRAGWYRGKPQCPYQGYKISVSHFKPGVCGKEK